MRLTNQAHELLKGVVVKGDTVIDATCGNGHDTLFLAELVGPLGKVFAFDVQKSALDRCAERLKERGRQNVTLIQASHADMAQFIPKEMCGQVAAFMFNLGYLPGSDRKTITLAETTLPAIEACLSYLSLKGLGTVMVYRGHAGGAQESGAVLEFLASRTDVATQTYVANDSPKAPYLLTLERKERNKSLFAHE